MAVAVVGTETHIRLLRGDASLRSLAY